jgi:hypothetical protein
VTTLYPNTERSAAGAGGAATTTGGLWATGVGMPVPVAAAEQPVALQAWTFTEYGEELATFRTFAPVLDTLKTSVLSPCKGTEQSVLVGLERVCVWGGEEGGGGAGQNEADGRAHRYQLKQAVH